MTKNDDKIRDQKLQYDINREAAKISTLSSGKIDKFEYATGEEILPSNQRQLIEQANFTYSSLEKAFEKQTEKQVDAIKSLDSANRLKQIGDIFPQKLMNDLIRAKLREIVELRDIIKKDDLNYKSKGGKTYNFSKNSLIHEEHLSIEKADNKRSNFANKLKNFDKGIKINDKMSFLNNLGLLFSAREKFLIVLKADYFQ